MAKKLILMFGSASAAKNYVEKAKQLKYVNYVTDYSRMDSNYNVMICSNTDFTEEQEQELKKLRKYK